MLWRIARRDQDVISTAELKEIGYDRDAIRHRRHVGRLHRQARGVYSVGSPHLTPLGKLMVVVKRCGKGAVLSHLSAAVHWGLRSQAPPKPHVTVPAARNPRPKGIVVHRRDGIGATRRSGIPVTTVLQTLIDCAPLLTRAQVERTINQADALELLRADALRERLRGRAEPGAGILREILDRDAFVLTDSELERLFVPIALRAGLPKPLTQQQVEGYRVDFYWPELKLVVEVDGLRYHRTALEQRRDLERTHALEEAGLTFRRFSYWQVAKDPAYTEGRLRRLRPPARTPDRPRAA